MKKSIAGYLKKDGTWEPQRDVEMHPLEEEAFLKGAHLQSFMRGLGQAPTKDEEQETLTEHGAEKVRENRAAYAAKLQAARGQVEALEAAAKESHDKWAAHIEANPPRRPE